MVPSRYSIDDVITFNVPVVSFRALRLDTYNGNFEMNHAPVTVSFLIFLLMFFLDVKRRMKKLIGMETTNVNVI